jgi:hypothetical protein
VQADDQVRRNLDRKQKVESIRFRVDDVIRRSQDEVQQRIRAQTRGSFGHSIEQPFIERHIQTKSANHYSPVRQQVIQTRTAYKPSEPLYEHQKLQ